MFGLNKLFDSLFLIKLLKVGFKCFYFLYLQIDHLTIFYFEYIYNFAIRTFIHLHYI